MTRKRKLGRGVAMVGAGMSRFGMFSDLDSKDLFTDAFKELTASEINNVLLDFERLSPVDVDRIQKNALVVGVSLDPEIEEDQVKMTRAFVAAIRFRDTKTGDRIVAEILRGEQ